MAEQTPKVPGGLAVKPAELIDIIRAAASAGVAHLKMGDIVIDFGIQRKSSGVAAAQSPQKPSAGLDWYNQEPPQSAIDD